MNNHKTNVYHRRSIRLKGYDYAQAGLYFITICTENRDCLFGEIVNNEMKLNLVGEIVKNEWINTPNIRKNTVIHEFIVMPNHIHMIIEIIKKLGHDEKDKFQSPSHNIGAIIRGYKIACIKKIKDLIDNMDNVQCDYKSIGTNCNSNSFHAIFESDCKIFQRNYWEHIIRDENDYSRISQYIIDNPQNWTNDKLFCE